MVRIVTPVRRGAAAVALTAAALAFVSPAASAAAPAGLPKLDVVANGFQTSYVRSISTSRLATNAPGELLIAIARADGPFDPEAGGGCGCGSTHGTSQGVRAVTGLGLTWTNVVDAYPARNGANSIWQAWAPTKVRGTVRAEFALPSGGMISVRSYTGAARTGVADSIGSDGESLSAADTFLFPQAVRSVVVIAGVELGTNDRPTNEPDTPPITSFFSDKAAAGVYWAQEYAHIDPEKRFILLRTHVAPRSVWALTLVEIPAADQTSS